MHRCERAAAAATARARLKPLLPPQPTPQPAPHDPSEAARRLIHARAADRRQARSQREAEDRARVRRPVAPRAEDADLDAAVEAS